MVHPLSIAVERGGDTIDRVERLPRRLPDGTIGIEYMGLVYPLVSAGRVSLDGRWCYPSEAPVCLEPPENLTDEAPRFWTLDIQGTRPYLFINGPERRLQQVLERLHASDVTVEHWGPSFREGATGLLYDWFVRLPGDGAAPSKWEIDQLLADVGSDDAEPPATTETLELTVARLRRDRERFAQQLIDAERELAKAVGLADTRAAELTALSDQAERLRRRLEAEVAFLKAGLQAARIAGSSVAATETLQELEGRLAAIEQDRDAALTAWSQAETLASNLRTDLEAAKARLEEVQATAVISPLVERGDPHPKKLRRGHQELETTLRVFVPTIRLLRSCADFILTEVDDRRDLLTKLKLLSEDPVALRGKRVHATDGWLEVHFSTGRGRDGRIYYKKMQFDSAAVWGVLVSDKAAQPNDFAWLGTQ